MRNSLETNLGIFVVIVVIAAWAVIETLGGVDLFHRGYHVGAQFDTVQELKVGDSVKMAGVEVGRVEAISLDETNNKVNVTMKLHPDAIVRTDSKAVIKFTGLMGENFVSIGFGTPSAPPAVEGALLETEDKATSGIENLTKSFTPDTINNLLGPLTDFMKQNSSHIGGAISNIENITAQVASGQGTVGKLIYDQSFYDSAMSTVTNLQDTVTQVKQVVNGVSAGQGTLGKLVTDETLYNSTTASMTNLNQILLKINQGQGTVGKLVNDQEFYKNAKLSLQKLDKATDSLEDTGPLSVIGTMLSAVGL